MPNKFYKYSKGPPDFKRMLQTGDTSHCCMKPRPSATNSHAHTDPVGPGAVERLKRRNEIHNSDDTYYEVSVKRECNVAVRPATDDDIRWEYDPDSSRQCARPYIRRPRSPALTNIVKCARRPNRKDMWVAVHPRCWEAIIDDKGDREIPGDVVAHLCNLDDRGREAEIELLRTGAEVCCYFKP